MIKYQCTKYPRFKAYVRAAWLAYLLIFATILFFMCVPPITNNKAYNNIWWYFSCPACMIPILLLLHNSTKVIQYFYLYNDRIVVKNMFGITRSILFFSNVKTCYLYKNIGHFRVEKVEEDFYPDDTVYLFIEDARKREKRVLNIYNRIDIGHEGPTASFFTNGKHKCFRIYYSEKLEQYLKAHNLNHYIIFDKNYHDESTTGVKNDE